jgi:deoxyribose-phosphate aldolase
MDDVRSLHAATAGGQAEAGADLQESNNVPEKAEDFAKKIDYPLLAPALIEDQLYRECLTARTLGIGSIVVRPCDVDSALRYLGLGVIKVGSVAGHPYGGNATAVKVYEARDLLRRGVKQINAYPNPGTMLSRQFQHQEVELIQLADSCIESGATLKIVLDNELLNEEMKIILCRMAKRVNAHFITTTQPKDLELILKYCGFHVSVECGGVSSLEEARKVLAMGCARFTTTVPESILNALQAEQAAKGKTPS